MSHIENLKAFDPFADANKGDDESVQEGLVHIRIQQRNGRKTLTTVQGLSSEYDFKKIVKVAKKEFACNGTVVEHPEYGEVVQLQVLIYIFCPLKYFLIFLINRVIRGRRFASS